MFVLAFLAVHIVSLVLDPYAGVGIAGAFIPGLSSYRSSPVALGTLALYALILTGLTARYTKLLPAGFWLKIHRLSLVVFILAWLHGMLAGTDAEALRPMYLATGLPCCSPAPTATGSHAGPGPRSRPRSRVPAFDPPGRSPTAHH